MELDLATICDLAEYDKAVSDRDEIREVERRKREAEEQRLRAERMAKANCERERIKAQWAQGWEEHERQATAIGKAVGEHAGRVVDLSTTQPHERPVERVHINDLVVKTLTSTCKYEDHKIREVIALINVFDPKRGVTEIAVDAFCCPKCKRY